MALIDLANEYEALAAIVTSSEASLESAMKNLELKRREIEASVGNIGTETRYVEANGMLLVVNRDAGKIKIEVKSLIRA